MQHIIPPAFDSLVFAAVAREIQQDLLDGRITGLVQPDAYTVGLRLRTRRGTAGLLCSIHPRSRTLVRFALILSCTTMQRRPCPAGRRALT